MNHILYVLRHPIDGFWEMKNNNRGRYREVFLLLLLAVAAVIFDRQVRDFIFNANYNTSLNILKEVCIVILPVLLFTIANWTITTLSDGIPYCCADYFAFVFTERSCLFEYA